MRTRVPWQVLITVLLAYALFYCVLTVAAAICIWISWPHASALLLLASFLVLTFLVPLGLSWTSSAYKWLIPLHLVHQALTVLIYAGHYMTAGLNSAGGAVSKSFGDALYFSLATWSTLGAVDLTVGANIRSLPPLEALTCIFFLPVFTSVLWKMLEEMTPPSREAFLDKKRNRKI
jgi:hypothetical protein